MTGPLRVTAWLTSPLAGEPPQLDALLEWALAPFQEDFQAKQSQGLPHSRIDRRLPAPPMGTIAIPIMRVHVGKWLVACCSDPILPTPDKETVEHVTKRLAVEYAGLLAPSERKVVAMTNTHLKSYRLPLRVRRVECVRWFASGNRRSLKKALKDVHAIGKKVADGYGRIREWTIEDIAEDYTWFAKCAEGTVLMRTLPLSIGPTPWLPTDLIGYRKHFGSCCCPFWHPSRFTEIVQPC